MSCLDSLSSAPIGLVEYAANARWKTMMADAIRVTGIAQEHSSSFESMTAPAAVELPEQMQVYPLQSVVY